MFILLNINIDICAINYEHCNIVLIRNRAFDTSLICCLLRGKATYEHKLVNNIINYA